jgi:hypothetical protein
MLKVIKQWGFLSKKKKIKPQFSNTINDQKNVIGDMSFAKTGCL